MNAGIRAPRLAPRPRHAEWAEVDLGPKKWKRHLTANKTRAQRSDTVWLRKMERKRAMKIFNFKRELLLNIFWMIRSKIKMNWIFDITYFVFPERTCHLVCFNVVSLFGRIDILLRTRIEVDVAVDRLNYRWLFGVSSKMERDVFQLNKFLCVLFPI